MSVNVKVKAKEGIKVPMEFKPKSYITAEKTVEIELSAYYQRRINDGDLLEVANKKTSKD